MRTTVTLDPDVDVKLRQAASERGQSFKKVLNDAVRAGLTAETPRSKRYRFPSRNLGVRPHVDIEHALRLAGELEDAELLRKLELRK